MRGAWIEIIKKRETFSGFPKSLPMRGAWIEINILYLLSLLTGSLPMRGAWIEIAGVKDDGTYTAVAPHAGSVD